MGILGGKAREDLNKEKSIFEITCYSYEDLYAVSYEALIGHLNLHKSSCSKDKQIIDMKIDFKSRASIKKLVADEN